jgi:hypothetical protein
MPYWSVYCLYCSGYIVDALLECVPAAKRLHPAFKLLFHAEPSTSSLRDWALRHRFTQPGTHEPFSEYTYAEDAPPDETVP